MQREEEERKRQAEAEQVQKQRVYLKEMKRRSRPRPRFGSGSRVSTFAVGPNPSGKGGAKVGGYRRERSATRPGRYSYGEGHEIDRKGQEATGGFDG